MTTNHTRSIGAEVATTEEEQRRSQAPRPPIIPILRQTYLSPYSANCSQPKAGYRLAEFGTFWINLLFE